MSRDLIHELDHSMPAATHAALGTKFQALIVGLNAVLAKLDALGNVANNSVALLNAAAGTTNVATYQITDLVTAGATAP
jgi:hypothetical protein